MSRSLPLLAVAGLAAAGGPLAARLAQAQSLNPDISVIGQPFLGLTDDPADPARERPRLDTGEAEFVFDAALNPYARGSFILSLSADGMELEEGYFDLTRGLPLGLALRGGQYRVGFGRLNLSHPHTLPFAERFGVLAAYLPGEEAAIETGLSLSERIPIAGDFSVLVAGDWLQGDSFRIARPPSGDPNDPGDDRAGETRPGWAARASGFSMLGEQSGVEFGLSALGGTNNVAAATRTAVYGADAKAKLWTSPAAHLLLQAEVLVLDREEAGWDATRGYTRSRVEATGFYLFADYAWARRYDLGVSYEGFEQPAAAGDWDQSVGAFAGMSLLEETTVFRADWRRTTPEQGDRIDTFTLRAVFSMGPHKAHQF